MLYAWILAACALLAPSRDASAFAAALAPVVEAQAPLYRDDDSRTKTAALMVAIAFRESSFRPDALGDSGHSYGYFQIWGVPRETPAEDQARIALGMVRESMRACGKDNPLGIYSAGPNGCVMPIAKRISADRAALAKWLSSKLKGAAPSVDQASPGVAQAGQ